MSAFICQMHSGCRSVPHVMSAEEKVILVAQLEARHRFGWKRTRIEYIQHYFGGWHVMIWSVPEKPGSFVVFDITEDGIVVGYDPGL